MQTPVLGFGAAPIARYVAHRLAEPARAPADPVQEAHQTIRHAVAQGRTLLDTAPLYGAGRSERLLGEALAPLPREEAS